MAKENKSILEDTESVIMCCFPGFSCIVSWYWTVPIHPSIAILEGFSNNCTTLVISWLLPLVIPAGSTSNLRVPTALAELEKRKEPKFEKGLRVKQWNRNPLQKSGLEHDASTNHAAIITKVCAEHLSSGLKTYRFLSKETWTWCGTWTCKKEYWPEKRRQNLQFETGKTEVVDALH